MRVPTAAAVCFSGAAAALALGAYARGDATAMFRNDPAHNGVYASVAPRLTTVRWRFKTGGKIMSSPAFSDGAVYVGSFDQNLYAIDARSGTRLWAFQTRGPVNSSPAVAAGTVYFSSLDGDVYAVGATNGRERWHFKTLGEQRFSAPGIHGMIPRTERMPDPFDVFLSSPVISNGTLYIGSGDSHVYALDAQTGALRWSFKTGNVVHATPAVAGDTVYVGSWDRYFYALDARTGAVKWKFITGDDRDIYNQVGIAGSAAVSGDTVFFGCRDSFFYALNARTGALRWKHNEHGSWVIGSPAVQNGNVYYTTSDERRFWALNAATGAELFSIPYGSASFSSPSIAGNMAYFGAFDGRLYGIDLKTGKIGAQFSTDGSRRNLSAHLNAKGDLDIQGFYRDDTFEGIVAGLDRVFSLGSIFGSPAIVNGILYIGSTDGTLYALQ